MVDSKKNCWSWSHLCDMRSWTDRLVADAYPEHTGQELMRMRIRNKIMPPLKLKITSLYFSHKVNYTERLSGVKIMKDRKSHTLGTVKFTFSQHQQYAALCCCWKLNANTFVAKRCLQVLFASLNSPSCRGFSIFANFLHILSVAADPVFYWGYMMYLHLNLLVALLIRCFHLALSLNLHGQYSLED